MSAKTLWSVVTALCLVAALATESQATFRVRRNVVVVHTPVVVHHASLVRHVGFAYAAPACGYAPLAAPAVLAPAYTVPTMPLTPAVLPAAAPACPTQTSLAPSVQPATVAVLAALPIAPPPPQVQVQAPVYHAGPTLVTAPHVVVRRVVVAHATVIGHLGHPLGFHQLVVPNGQVVRQRTVVRGNVVRSRTVTVQNGRRSVVRVRVRR